MKRSTINAIIKDTMLYLEEQKFYLPEWAYWTMDTWKSNSSRVKVVCDAKLGWDVTDFAGNFNKTGLVLFTIRNGSLEAQTRPYCEKIIVMDGEQVAPYHYHKEKTEDIINRSKTPLALKLGRARPDGSMASDELPIVIDGITRVVRAKEEVVLMAGQSITLYPHDYHTFYPKGGKILIGEVSKINDDDADNFFLESIPRFPTIEEDEPLVYPLVNDYTQFM